MTASEQPPIIERIFNVTAVVVVLVSLVAAFVGLSASSFWFDELWTVLVIGTDHDLGAMLNRAALDYHPPGYYLVQWAIASVTGVSETALRATSAVFAGLALVVFGIGTRATYSRPARMAALVVAATSTFWFLQAQNARPYGFLMLVGTVQLLLAQALVARYRQQMAPGWRLAALFGVSLIGSFSHFYMMFLGCAVFAVLVLFCRRWLPRLAVMTILLAAATLLYVQLVVRPSAIYLPGKSWIGGSAHWYVAQVKSAASLALGLWPARVIIGLVLFAAVLRIGGQVAAGARGGGGRGDWGQPRYVPVLVPPLVLLAGLVTSILSEPNLTARNLLVSAPFIWASLALLYDVGLGPLVRGPAGLSRSLALAALAAMTVLAVVGGARVLQRGRPVNTPYRESAQWILAQPGCREAVIPVLISDRSPMRPGGAEMIGTLTYGHYMPGQRLQPVLIRALLAGQASVAPSVKSNVAAGCRVVAWGAHHVDGAKQAEQLRAVLAQQTGMAISVRRFTLPDGAENYRPAYVFLILPVAGG
jgi:hypothetical protein